MNGADLTIKQDISITYDKDTMYFKGLTKVIVCYDDNICKNIYELLKNNNIDCKIDNICNNRISIVDMAITIKNELIDIDTRKLTIHKYSKIKGLKKM